ncbi:leucine-rich repeat-containing protein 56 [Eptesicus fuscus]|uniref:leucine-rich repeat-containing protein 56 n=1 Tax=Eptesicus fuscus TaxID=29078 RepID=UPI0024041E05|nr:leucine-rich repeat-containing protein 56 [Eptesicus fuscus]XP_054580890.1 leucine-rich repeat-containing protein 56 [Eptesicus fuscus]
MFDPQWEKTSASRLDVNGPDLEQAPGPRPSMARVLVRELSWQGPYNPRPQSKSPGGHRDGHGKRLAEECLSAARLQALAQVDDLRLVSTLEMCVDTREHSLGNFGVHLPNLSQLKLNDSRLGSVRDLGTSLGRLQVLWLARCGLTDLDGIGSFLALKELYVSYNNVSDLSPLCLLEQLEVLDLEGNNVEDLGQVRYLQLCPRLAMLTLEGNLVCLQPSPSSQVPPGYNYRAQVRKLIPQLQVLDEMPATQTGLPAARKLDQDWLLVKEAIKEGSVLDSLLPKLDHPHGDPIGRFGPELSRPELQPRAARPWPLSLLGPGGPVPEALLPKDTAPEDDTSNLTHGSGQVLCGNPTKGLRERQHRCQTWVPPEQLPPHRPEDLATRASTPGPDPADSRDLLALAGLRAWRELQLRRLDSGPAGAAAPRGPRRGPEEPEDKAEPKISPGSPSQAPGPSRTSGYHLLPSPPKVPMPPDSGGSSWGSKDLQFRGRRLRALGRSGPSLGPGLAAVAALRSALEVATGPSSPAQGCPGPRPAPDPAARPPALWCLPRLKPLTPAQSHP